MENGDLGPLVRHTSTAKQMTHSNRVMRYVEKFRQMIVPNDQIMMCMEITHTALGHPGFHRMLQTVRKSYFWKSRERFSTYFRLLHIREAMAKMSY